jgi:hypothetical protein
MAVHEIEKNLKIIDEVVFHLFNKGYHKFDFSLDFKPEISIITIIVEDPDKKVMNKIRNEIHCDRDEELEEYGWELMGESRESSEIICVGMLVDNMDLNHDGTNLKITLYRNH